MSQEQLITLAQIYNSLLTIETRGNSTCTMAKCLETLQKLIKDIQGEKGVTADGKQRETLSTTD